LHSELEEVGGASSLGVVLVGPGRPYSQAEVGKVLAQVCGGRSPVLASVAWDPKTATAFSAGAPVRRLESSKLARSLRALDEAALAAVASHSEALEQVRA